jgi:hypothetical protein
MSGPDRLYVDILKAGTSQDRGAEYFKRYGQDLIKRASDYYLAIDRFDISCLSIPLYRFESTPNYYLVEMEYNGTFSGPISLTFIPSYINYPQTDPRYYNIFNYDIMLRMVNNAIASALTTLGTMVTLPVGAVAPFFYADKASLLLKYVAQEAIYDTFSASPIKLYMNRALHALFIGMPIFYDRTQAVRNAQILAYSTGDNVDINGLVTMTTNKSISTLLEWNVCRGLLLTTNYVPCELEDIPTVASQETALPNRIPCLANFDFTYDASSPMPDRAQYIVTGIYKLIDMISNMPVNVMDLKVYWYDSFNQTYPLDLNIGKTMSIRNAFVKRGTAN